MIDSITTGDIYYNNPNRIMNNDQPKRFRAGSISGRLRTASDLEEIGYIDKNQKGILKDLIISDDAQLRHALDKFEEGDKTELLDLIQSGIFERKSSIDILDGLDFDFLNVINAKRDRLNSLDEQFSFAHHFDDSLNNDVEFGFLGIKTNRSGSISDPSFLTKIFTDDFEKERIGERRRHSSIDSTNSSKILDYLTAIGYENEEAQASATSYPFGLQQSNNGNRIVQAFSKKNDHNTIDMSAYTAVAKSLQTNSNMNLNLKLSSNVPSRPKPITPTVKEPIVIKEKPAMSILNSQFNISSLPGSSAGVPTATKHSDNPDNKGVVGAYTLEQRRKRIDKFLEKRSRRVWTKKVKYDVRKNFADSRLRVKGRFVKKEEEHIMRELLDV